MTTKKEQFDRRAFFKAALGTAGAAVTSSVLHGCARMLSTVEPTAGATRTPTSVFRAPTSTLAATAMETPIPTPELEIGPKGRVVLVKTEARADGIRRALELLEFNPVRGKDIFLKPNFNSADPFPGSTHQETLLALVEGLREMQVDHITIGDRSGMGDTRTVMHAKGIFGMADELGLSTLVFDDLGAEEWILMQPESSHWQKGFAVPKPMLEAEGIVQTCCLKTHRYGGHFTLSLKNSVGVAAQRIPGYAYDYMTELHNSAHQRRMIAEINQAYQPDLILLDGMEAFVEGGPARGKKVAPGVILAASDRVALDAVGVAILRFYGTTAQVAEGPIFAQEQIARAVELGLGVEGPQEIDLITSDPASESFAAPIRDLLVSG
jgi:uncharacterized protein (DUF362 family)